MTIMNYCKDTILPGVVGVSRKASPASTYASIQANLPLLKMETMHNTSRLGLSSSVGTGFYIKLGEVEARITARQASLLLDEKIRQKYSNLYKAFIDMDRDRDGFINMTDLREHMKRLGVNVSGVEFRKLWDMVDPNRRRKLSFLEFNDRFANLISPNFASMPLSRRPSTPPLKEWQEPRVEKAYIRKLRDIDDAFQSCDVRNTGRLSHNNFMTALRKFGLTTIGYEEGLRLMMRFDPAGEGNSISREAFHDCVVHFLRLKPPAPREDPGELSLMNTLSKSAPPPLIGSTVVGVRNVARTRHRQQRHNIEEIMNLVIRELGRKDARALLDEFQKHDRENQGSVGFEALARVFKASQTRPVLTRSQMEALFQHYDMDNLGEFDYELFIKNIHGQGDFANTSSIPLSTLMETAGRGKAPETNYRPWKDLGIQPVLNIKNGQRYTQRELAYKYASGLGFTVEETEMIQSLVGRKQEFQDACQLHDIRGDGFLNGNDFSDVLLMLQVRPNRGLIETLARKFPAPVEPGTNARSITNQNRIQLDTMLAFYAPYLAINEANLASLGLELTDPVRYYGKPSTSTASTMATFQTSNSAYGSGGGGGAGLKGIPFTRTIGGKVPVHNPQRSLLYPGTRAALLAPFGPDLTAYDGPDGHGSTVTFLQSAGSATYHSATGTTRGKVPLRPQSAHTGTLCLDRSARLSSGVPRHHLPSSAHQDDAASVNTANLNLARTAEKMKRVLGRHVATVITDVKERAVKEAYKRQLAAPLCPPGATASSLPTSLVQSALGDRGIALSAKEARALSHRYSNGGPVPQGGEEGIIDVDRMLADMLSPRGRLEFANNPNTVQKQNYVRRVQSARATMPFQSQRLTKEDQYSDRRNFDTIHGDRGGYSLPPGDNRYNNEEYYASQREQEAY